MHMKRFALAICVCTFSFACLYSCGLVWFRRPAGCIGADEAEKNCRLRMQEAETMGASRTSMGEEMCKRADEGNKNKESVCTFLNPWRFKTVRQQLGRIVQKPLPLTEPLKRSKTRTILLAEAKKDQ